MSILIKKKPKTMAKDVEKRNNQEYNIVCIGV